MDKNTQVVYYVSTGKAEEDTNVTIPSGLVGESLSSVQSTLQDLGLKINVEKQQSSSVEVGKVISLNPGEKKKPLGMVASGGELSRIMLAVKSVLADKDEVETLIFDEIDTGISGRTAQKVSEKMALLGKRHQVLCITHLAQIAAMADAHYLIEKSDK